MTSAFQDAVQPKLLGYDFAGVVVRCRDCKHARVLHPLSPITGVPTGIEDWRCDYFWNADELPEVEPDGFCAWGLRRGE